MSTSITAVSRLLILFFEIIFTVIGFFFLSIGIYIMVGDFSNINTAFYTGSGTIVILLGIVIILSGYMGINGTTRQLEKYKNSFLRRLPIVVFILLLVGYLIALVYLLAYSIETFNHLSDTLDSVQDGDTNAVFSNFEESLSDRFNIFFFGAANGCTGSYDWFWQWVNDNCPDSMSKTKCEKCNSYDVTFCVADQDTCYRESDDGTSIACAYYNCREEVLDFLVNDVQLIAVIVIAAACGMVFAVLLLNFKMYCHDPTQTAAIKVSDTRREMEEEQAQLEEIDDAILAAEISNTDIQGSIREEVIPGALTAPTQQSQHSVITSATLTKKLSDFNHVQDNSKEDEDEIPIDAITPRTRLQIDKAIAVSLHEQINKDTPTDSGLDTPQPLTESQKTPNDDYQDENLDYGIALQVALSMSQQESGTTPPENNGMYVNTELGLSPTSIQTEELPTPVHAPPYTTDLETIDSAERRRRKKKRHHREESSGKVRSDGSSRHRRHRDSPDIDQDDRRNSERHRSRNDLLVNDPDIEGEDSRRRSGKDRRSGGSERHRRDRPRDSAGAAGDEDKKRRSGETDRHRRRHRVSRENPDNKNADKEDSQLIQTNSELNNDIANASD